MANTQYIELIDTILNSMSPDRLSTTGLMLAGSPGVGKTSFVKMFARLMGMNIITVEVPHVVEEHIINVPFVVFDVKTNKTKGGVTQVEKNDNAFDIVLSDSHLATELNKKPDIKTDIEYLDYVYTLPKHIISLWEELGGDESTIPSDIKAIRSKFKTILFVDEFWRKTSPSIRNMFRTILNGDIGIDKIPSGTYVIYASNLSDTGGADAIEEWTLNTDFDTVEMSIPSFENWAKYLVDEHGLKKNGGVIDPNILKILKPILEDETDGVPNLSYTDDDNEVRISPRRWEQIIVYVSSSLPVEDSNEAQEIINNVRVNFRNYKSGDYAKLSNKVVNVIKEYIEKKHNVNIKVESDDRKWFNTLKHQLEQKMKTGGARAYVPVISGLPGIAKTSLIKKLGADLGLKTISIDCSTLNKEDVIGIPIPGEDRKSLLFSKPKLLTVIERKLEAATEPDPAKVKQNASINKAKYKYLIFLDELNRVKNVEVFNSLRRILLDKKFADEWPLPEGSLMAGAINPHDANTLELTEHMQDVLDIIPAGPSLALLKEYIQKDISSISVKNNDAKKVSLSVLDAFMDRFKGRNLRGKDAEFFLQIGGEVYMSPREYSNMLENTIRSLDRIMSRSDKQEMEANEREKLYRKTVYTSFSNTLKTVLRKHGISDPNWFNDLYVWMVEGPEFSYLFDDVVKVKSKEIGDFMSIVQKQLKNPSRHMYNDTDFINYINNVSKEQLVDDLTKFLNYEFTDFEKLTKFIKNKNLPEKTLTNAEEGIVDEVKDSVAQIEFIIRELLHGMKVHNKIPGGLDAISDAVFETVSTLGSELSDQFIESDILSELSAIFDGLTSYVETTLRR
jgi:MoxR-like ATPase